MHLRRIFYRALKPITLLLRWLLAQKQTPEDQDSGSWIATRRTRGRRGTIMDAMKMQIMAVSIKYAKQLKVKQKRTEKTLETEILMLERKLENNWTFPKFRSVRSVRN